MFIIFVRFVRQSISFSISPGLCFGFAANIVLHDLKFGSPADNSKAIYKLVSASVLYAI